MKILKIEDKYIYAVVLCIAVSVSASSTSANGLSEGSTRIANSSHNVVKQEKKQARKEFRQLKRLSKRALEAKGKKGDPLAWLAMAHQFSAEATSLAATPVLANSAAEDAIRLYNLAAQAGALQKRPITGLSVRPLRASRKRQR